MEQRLIDALRTDIREVEDDSVKTLILMWRAADALEAAEQRIDNLQQTCNKLASNLQQAQLPKEGEWIMDGKYNRHCSRCNEDVVWSFNYCPNCGAKMDAKEGIEE